MKTTYKQVLALLLAVALLLLLCACAQIQQLKGTDSATLPETLAGQASETQSEEPTQHSEITESQRAQHSEATEPQQAQYIGSEEGKNSLLRLRDKIDFPQTMFGMAYLGYVGGLFEEGFEAGFPAWLWETNAALLLEYPFIAEIDAEHIIGGAGHLYCIVPVDENATVVINRVQWNEKTKTDEVTDVLYRSESGEPVLLFANLDGIAYEADTQVFITDNNGNTCEWYPSLDAMSYLAPCISEAGDYLSFDFTEYAWYNAPPEFAGWLSDGWTIQTIPNGPSYVTINISLVGGKNYGVTDGPMYLCETYPLLISPSGTELLVGAGESGICLPFMSQSTLACVLTQSAG